MDQILHTPPDELVAIASKVLGAAATPLGKLSVEKIGHSFGQATVGIYWVTGRATTSAGEQLWSAVVKVLGTPAIAVAGLESDAQREVEVYRAGEFAELCGGIRAAHCYAIQQRDERQFMWLEDLSQAPQPPWPTEQYIDTAHHLGQFNAHWPETACPPWEWLNQMQFRDFFKRQPFQGALERLADPQSHPQIAQVMPPEVVAETLQFWHESERLFEKIAATPQGICHLDCHPRNLFPKRNCAGDGYTVAIDWSQVGIGALGMDVGHLLADPIKQMILPDEALRAFTEAVFMAYVDGLTEAGWSGDLEQIRFAFLTRLGCEALRNITVAILSVENPEIRKQAEKIRKDTSDKSAARRIDAQRFFLRFKDEAFQLL